MSSCDGSQNGRKLVFSFTPCLCSMSSCAASGYVAAMAMRMTGVGAGGMALGFAVLGCLLSVLVMRVFKAPVFYIFPWELGDKLNWNC